MKFVALIPYYFAWHYTTALKELFRIWKNFLWFSLHYFSVRILLKTLFRRFFNVKEKSTTKELAGEAKIVTILMSGFGMALRLLSILTGLFAWVVIFVGGLLTFVFWFFLPFILLFFVLVGLAALLQIQNNL